MSIIINPVTIVLAKHSKCLPISLLGQIEENMFCEKNCLSVSPLNTLANLNII